MKEEMNDNVENLAVTDELENNVEKKEPFWNKIPFLKEKNRRILAYVILVASVFLIVFGFFLMKGYSIFGWAKRSLVVLDIQSKSIGSYVNLNETFEIKTKNGSLDEVRKHIYVEPAVNYEIKEKRKNLYELVTQDLPSDTIINLDYVDNQVIEDKWAFQSTKDLKVNSVYPVDGASGISVYSDIEIVFSYPDLDDINGSVEISPAVDGEFVQSGRNWILHPTTPLQGETNYTITIKNDIRRGNQVLQEPVQTTFSTKVSTASPSSSTSIAFSNYNSITVDGISTFRPVDPIMFRLSTYGKIDSVSKVDILKVKSANDFEKFLLKQDVPMESLGEIPFHNVSGKLYTVDKNLDVGYYVLRGYASGGELLFSIPVQVSDLSVFLLSSQSDLLVWVGSDNHLLKDIPVVYEGQSVKTDQDGIAVIKNFNQLENQIKYVKVGSDNPIYVGVDTNDHLQCATGYVYTDRPLYKNTDEIQFWGYIPLKYYDEWEDFSTTDFVFSINDVTVPIKVLKDGTFIGTYSLDNYKDGYVTLKLSYKNHSIATRWVEVRQYEKENYNFSIDMEKNYVEAGNPFHFTVSVQHISGIMVPNKEIRASVDGTSYTSYTDAYGVASFDIPTQIDGSDSTLFQYKYLTVSSSLSEYASKGVSVRYFVVNRFASASTQYDKDTKTITADVYHINMENDKSVLSSPDDLVDKNLPYSGDAQIIIEEQYHTRYVAGYHYNEFTKETVPWYNWNTSTRNIRNDKISIKNGKFEYKVSYEEKESTEDYYYVYYASIFFKDSRGNNVMFKRYLFSTSVSSYENSIVGYYGGYGSQPSSLSSEYNLYTYHFDIEGELSTVYSSGTKFSVDEDIKGALYHYSGSKELEGNPLLLVKYKNTILDKQIYTNQDEIQFSFTDDDRPGISIAGAYFKDGVFYRLPSRYNDYQDEDSKLDVEIVPESTSYSPGQKVNVDIYVRQKNKGKKAKINVSVVDEGIFTSLPDSTPILNNLYSNRYYYQYLYSTYRDYSLSFTEGGGSGSTSGGERSNFGDTLYFDAVETDKNGKARISFTLNDSITSFRITVHAATDNADVGVNHTNITSSLPLSVNFVEPRGLKQTDDVVLNASSLGVTNDKVNYEFSIEGVEQTIQKEALIGQTVYASFGKLPVGEYKAHIKAKSGNETDAVSFPIQVKMNQMEISVKNTFGISEKSTITPTKNPIVLELYRNSFKSYEEFLDIIRATNEERLDTKISYAKALTYENRYLEDKNVVEFGNLDSFKGDMGWKFLPGEGVSYELTAFASYYYEELRYDKSIYYDIIQKNQSLAGKLRAYVVLAAMKEPVLDDLNLFRKEINNLDADSINDYVLAYLFLGDYQKVRKYFSKVTDESVKTYLSTFVDKENAAQNINHLISTDITDRYLYFSIISYFENNNVELDTKEEVMVSYGNEKQKVELSSLGKKVLTIYQNDLKDLNITSKYKDISYSYYYEGGLEEIDDSLKNELISTSISNTSPFLGDIVYMDVDLSAIAQGSSLKIYLPNGLRLSNGFSSNIAYIQSNKIDYLSIKVHDKSESMLRIPLYAASPGNYVIEPIVVKDNDRYILSNALEISIQG